MRTRTFRLTIYLRCSGCNIVADDELKMALSKPMLLLSPMFVYMGMEMTFWMNVYGTALGYTLRFGTERERLVGLNGMVVGAGQIAGGFIYGLSANWFRKRGRDLGTLIALLLHFAAFYLAFVTLPDTASLEETDKRSYFAIDSSLAMICSFLLGFGDAGWNNPLFSLLDTLHPHNPVAAFAVFQGYQAIGNLISFAYSTCLTLPYQLAILVVAGVAGQFGFCIVEWKAVSDEVKAHMSKCASVASQLSEGTVATSVCDLDLTETKV
ncbi:UNC93-like protein MFSD11 [Paramacrobiotus metropolitanus]|uniref:UNC93-like protein MFSD11 n=1 Tax=Paramacrobiotus metropolitanus TaxID=2943436 RepID=UPI002445B9E9|nr:UNC93-like protein MFSD11 [Paramacrobiotus metropolitanus]